MTGCNCIALNLDVFCIHDQGLLELSLRSSPQSVQTSTTDPKGKQGEKITQLILSQGRLTNPSMAHVLQTYRDSLFDGNMSFVKGRVITDYRISDLEV